jgi:hypothetical protein
MTEQVACTGPNDHSVTIRIGNREITARHAVNSDPAALLPCWDYAVISETGITVAYILVNEFNGNGPYEVFSATDKMRYLGTFRNLPDAIGRGWQEAS